MQTNFSARQLADPGTREAEKVLRACVHCGMCTATCPTYTLRGDELDSPRGRIYLIKEMLENDRAATATDVKHIDRCLSCLACMTTCPSGVNFMHLVDHARHHIERTYRRPWPERMLRRVLGEVLPRPNLFRAALLAAKVARAVCRPAARPAAGDAGPGAGTYPRAKPGRPPAGFSGCRRTQTARGDPQRLRAARPVAANQRGDDPASDAAWLRGCGGGRRRLLRRPAAPFGPGRAGPGPRQHTGVDAAEGPARSRRRRHQRVRLRHHGQGLRFHVQGRCRIARAGGGGFRHGARHQRVDRRAWSASSGDPDRAARGLSRPPARFSMANKFTKRRKTSWLRPGSASSTFRTDISAAAPPAPTTSCNPKSRRSYAT